MAYSAFSSTYSDSELSDSLLKWKKQHIPKILDTPEPTVTVLELADSSVNFAVRPWCKTEDYWKVYFDVTEQTKIELDKAGIEIPYPHAVEIQKKG